MSEKCIGSTQSQVMPEIYAFKRSDLSNLSVKLKGPLPRTELATTVLLAVQPLGRYLRIEFKRQPFDRDGDFPVETRNGFFKSPFRHVTPRTDCIRDDRYFDTLRLGRHARVLLRDVRRSKGATVLIAHL